MAPDLSIAHCGQCSQFSNPHNIKTIAKDSKKCGPNQFLGSYEDLVDCLDGHIGFTRPCTYCLDGCIGFTRPSTYCLANSMKSTTKKCLSTCICNLFSGFMTNNNMPSAGNQGWLNYSLVCAKKIRTKFCLCSGVSHGDWAFNLK
ncbi:hypothetical protein ACA910_002044 [Epithemia clementina (nom. ined.)]